jgi:hypothetical protein
MSRCQTEIDKYTDVTKLPVDVNHCGGVMQAVQAPFTQTSVYLPSSRRPPRCHSSLKHRRSGLESQRRWQQDLHEHLRRPARRRLPGVRHELAAGPGRRLPLSARTSRLCVSLRPRLIRDWSDPSATVLTWAIVAQGRRRCAACVRARRWLDRVQRRRRRRASKPQLAGVDRAPTGLARED